MSKTYSFAKTELDILVKSATPDNRPIIEPFIPEILALVDKFGNSGQSGGSAPLTAGALSQAVKKLCIQQPICPITGHPDEWGDVSSLSADHGTCFQNKRCYALFKNGDGKCYYLDAIIFKTQKGSYWSGTATSKTGIIYSRQYVKSFPFEPKQFIIDVIETEPKKDFWEFHIKDEKQLEEVFNYYDRFEEGK